MTIVSGLIKGEGGGGISLSANNTFTGNNIFQGIVDVNNVDAEGSGGANLRTSGGTNCLSWGGGGSANLTAGGNLSMGSNRIVSCADPSGAQDVATKAYVDANSGSEIGNGQSWTDMGASRTFGVTYTNSTGKSIQLGITFELSASDTFQVLIDGVLVMWSNAGSSTGVRNIACPIIPNGSTYRIDRTQGNGAIEEWWELR